MTSENPIDKVTGNTIDELFSRDPTTYTQEDIAGIVMELRRKRKEWLLSEQIEKGKAPATKRGPATKLTNVELGDLGL